MSATASDRPNILLIVTDTQRWDSLRCMGADHAVSPHLDRLAAEGVLFEQAHTACPVCGPARCSLLTGLQPSIHGALENGLERRTDLAVFPDRLAQAGYTNVLVGKSHFGSVPASFYVQHVLAGEKNQDRDDFYARHIRALGHSRATSEGPSPIPEDQTSDALVTTTTIEELDRLTRCGDRPWFAMCSLLSPHEPFDPPGRWATLFDDRDLPPLIPGPAQGQPRWLDELLDLGDEPDARTIDRRRRLYYGLCAYCDHQVGRLMAFLDDQGLRENTLVIFTSDHGTTLHDHGLANKHNFYDVSWRVPLVMSMPGTLPAGERRSFATWTDLTATILGAAGSPDDAVHGYDLFTPLSSGEPSPRTCAAASLYRTVALATAEWKLEYDLARAEGRLFDRQEDPQETTDLYHDPAHRALRQELVEALLQWRCNLQDIGSVRSRLSGGGPVAKRVAGAAQRWLGVDADELLQNRLPVRETYDYHE